jgi:hypothetical protein
MIAVMMIITVMIILFPLFQPAWPRRNVFQVR